MIDDDNKIYINFQITFKHKYWALKAYNPTISTKIFNSSMAHFKTYKKQLESLNYIKLEDTPAKFNKLENYHIMKYILNKFLFDMMSI